MKAYNGGKNGSGTYQAIINQIPPHDIYIELFLGSGAIIKRKKPAKQNYGIEINAGVIAEYHFKAGYTVINDCAISYLDEMPFAYGKETFIYADPPYLGKTRSDSSKVLYDYEMKDEERHFYLLKLLKATSAMVAISAYENPFYDEILSNWRKVKFMSMTRQGLKEECLYCNYEAPKALHDYSYLGNNNTQRQMIKRKIERITCKLKQLPDLERKAIIASLQSSHILQP